MHKTIKNIPTFWVTNISNRNVSLADLAINIKAFTTINLLDSKHHYYTLDQLMKSSQSGSLFKKRDKIVIRKLAPQVLKNEIGIKVDTILPSREKSVLEIKEEHYEELNVADSEKDLIEYAKENADIVQLDEVPLKAVK